MIIIFPDSIVSFDDNNFVIKIKEDNIDYSLVLITSEGGMRQVLFSNWRESRVQKVFDIIAETIKSNNLKGFTKVTSLDLREFILSFL